MTRIARIDPNAKPRIFPSVINIEQVNEFSTTSVAQVIHQIEGRLRVRILWLQEYPSMEKRLESLLLSVLWVREVRINLKTNSVTITYQSTKISLTNFTENLLKSIHRMTPADFQEQKVQKEESFVSPSFGNHLQELGGRMVGSSAGQIIGRGFGIATGRLLLGPLGIIPGRNVGSFIGQVIGGNVGIDSIRNLQQNNDPTPNLGKVLERGGREIMMEALGGFLFGAVGSATLGVPGLIFGRIVGGAIGSQVSDDLWYIQSTSKRI